VENNKESRKTHLLFPSYMTGRQQDGIFANRHESQDAARCLCPIPLLSMDSGWPTVAPSADSQRMRATAQALMHRRYACMMDAFRPGCKGVLNRQQRLGRAAFVSMLNRYLGMQVGTTGRLAAHLHNTLHTYLCTCGRTNTCTQRNSQQLR
jgi:hypothetical protein